MAIPEPPAGETRDPAEVAAEFAKREAWAEAVPLWCAALSARPGDRTATVGLGDAIASLGAPGAAAVLIRDILAKYPDDLRLALAATLMAERGREWAIAIQIRRRLSAEAPDDAKATAALGRVLRDGGKLDESTAAMAAADARFPDSFEILRQRAVNAMVSENWVLARECWTSMVRLNPQDSNAVNRVKMCGERAAAAAAAAGPIAVPEPPRAAKHQPTAELRAVLDDVVSLGAAPDLVTLLRDYGCEPAGPFASARASTPGVIAAVRARFAGFGEVAQMRLEADGADYLTVDTKYDIRSPSHVATTEVASPDILVRAGEAQRSARDLLLSQMETGAKLFVHAAPALSDAEIDSLMGAMRDIGPVTVLFVRAGGSGTIEEIQEGMFVAGIDRLDAAAAEPSAMWVEFCTVAHRRLAARAALGGFASRRRAA